MKRARDFDRALDGIRTPEAARTELRNLHEERVKLADKLSNLERQIYQLEGSYLQETKHLGNILTGWDSYLSSRSGALRRPMKFKDADRLFTLSSATAMAHVNDNQDGSGSGNGRQSAAGKKRAREEEESNAGDGDEFAQQQQHVEAKSLIGKKASKKGQGKKAVAAGKAGVGAGGDSASSAKKRPKKKTSTTRKAGPGRPRKSGVKLSTAEQQS